MSGDAGQKRAIAEGFDRAAESYDAGEKRYFDHFARALVRHAALAPGDRVLDVATGTGLVLIEAARAIGPGGRAVGADISEGMLTRARVEIAVAGPADARVVLADGDRLPFAPGTFDVVLCGFGIFFMTDPDAALRDLNVMLRRGGRMAISTWSRETGKPQFVWGQELLRRFVPDGTPTRRNFANAFDDPDEIAATFSRAGFDDILVTEETLELVFADADEWWEWSRSHGYQGPLLAMDDAARARYKAAAFDLVAEHATAPDGVHLPMRALITTARAGV